MARSASPTEWSITHTACCPYQAADWGCDWLQSLKGGLQQENPDIWLNNGNPWEIPRPETTYEVGFYGSVDNFKWTPSEKVGPPALTTLNVRLHGLRCDGSNGVMALLVSRNEADACGRLPCSPCVMMHDSRPLVICLPSSTSLNQHCLQVIAKAYDNPIPGYGTATVGNLRLWESLPVNELNLGLFNEGKFSEVRSRPRLDLSSLHQRRDYPVAAALVTWPCPPSCLTGCSCRTPSMPGVSAAAAACALPLLLHGCLPIAGPSACRLQPRQCHMHSAAERC